MKPQTSTRLNMKQSIVFCSALLFFLFVFSGTTWASTPVKIGTFNNPPIVFEDVDGQIQGLAIDIVNAVAKQENWQVEYVHNPWATAYQQLEQNEIDLLVGIAFSSDRAEQFQFTSETLLSNWGKIYSSKEANITRLLDLEGKRIALMQQSIHSRKLKELLAKFTIDFVEIPAQDYLDTLKLVNAGQADAAVVNRVFSILNAPAFENLIETPILFNPVEVRFAAPKKAQHDFIGQIDAFLKSAKANPTSIYHESVNQWLDIQREARTPLWVKVSLSAIFAGLVLTIGFILLLRRQVRVRTQALAQSEEKYHSLFNDASDMIHIVDGNGIILDCNQSECDTLEYTQDELLGKKLLDIIAPEYQSITQEAFSKVRKGHIIKNYETCMVSKSGRKIPVEVSSSPRMSGDQFISTRSICRDITERKRAEEERIVLEKQLRQAQKMESIGQLTAGISHDFNNILNSIIGYTDLSLRVIDTNNFAKVKKYLQEVLTAGERAKDLISKMLTYSRKTPTEKKAILVRPVILEVSNLLSGMLPSNIHLELNLDKEVPPIEADALQIHQALLNLVINASHAIEGPGKITVGLDLVEDTTSICSSCQTNCSGQYVNLYVADDGSGIDEQIVSRLFDPFFTTKPIDKGTGMGLSVVHGIVHECQGHIVVDSQKDIGTTINLYFPPSQHVAMEDAPGESKIESGNGEHILVVDDEPSIAKMTSDLLTLNGYRVASFSDSEAAWQAFQEQADTIDAVISDFTMPKLSGVDLAERILQLKPGVIFILSTGYSDKINLEKANSLGISKVLHKPVSNTQLLLDLHALLEAEK